VTSHLTVKFGYYLLKSPYGRLPPTEVKAGRENCRVTNRSIWNEGIKTDPTSVVDSKKNQWMDSGKAGVKRTWLASVKSKKLCLRYLGHIKRHSCLEKDIIWGTLSGKKKTKHNIVRQHHSMDRYGLRKITEANGEGRSMVRSTSDRGWLKSSRVKSVVQMKLQGKRLEVDLYIYSGAFLPLVRCSTNCAKWQSLRRRALMSTDSPVVAVMSLVWALRDPVTLIFNLSARNGALSYTRNGEHFHQLWSFYDTLSWTYCPGRQINRWTERLFHNKAYYRDGRKIPKQCRNTQPINSPLESGQCL